MDSTTSCPKCSYVRKPADTAPAWQCPSCGIAYNKVRPTPAAAAAAPPEKIDNRVPGAILGSGETTSSGLVYLALMAIGIFVPSNKIWLLVLPLLACASFYYWISAYKRKRMIEDVPTSNIANAAQGYVELCGTVASAFDNALTGPITREPCVWYSYGIDENRGKDNSRTIEKGTAGVPFLIRDETGECLINPDKAELLCEMCQQWDEGNLHYSEWSIRIGDPIYAIGRFSTRTPPPASNLEAEANALLRTWLANPKGFFTRFDADRNGKIAAPELAKAREAAQTEVARQAAHKAAGLNTMVAPDDGRPFFIMNMSQGEVAGRFRQLTITHLVIFFIAIGFLIHNLF